MKKKPTSVPSADSTTPLPIERHVVQRASRRVREPFLDVGGADTAELLAREARHRADHRVLLELAAGCCRPDAGSGLRR